ncbi:MAG: hypothetical protein ACR2I4_02850, partial [Actinomycetota bacterium]
MSVSTDVSRGAQEQMLESIELTQKAALEGFKVWADAVEKMIPETPNAPNFLNEWPSVEESIDNAFDFAGKLLANQRAFTKSVIQTTRPVAKRAAEEASGAPNRTTAAKSNRTTAAKSNRTTAAKSNRTTAAKSNRTTAAKS